MIEIFKNRLIKIIDVVPVLDHMHSLEREFVETLRSTASQSNISAARMLIDHLQKGPHKRGWFEEFVSALQESENSQACLYVKKEDLPTTQQENKLDCCEKLIHYLSPKLVDLMNPNEVTPICFEKKLCSQEDVENNQPIFRLPMAKSRPHAHEAFMCVRGFLQQEPECGRESQINQQISKQQKNRELLSRITKKKDWFRRFVTVLHENGNLDLIKELTGVTYEEFIAGCSEESESQDDATKCKRDPQDGTSTSDGNLDVTGDSRQHTRAYSEPTTQPGECNEPCEPLHGAEKSKKDLQDDKVTTDVTEEETEKHNGTPDDSLLDSSFAESSATSDLDASLSELSLNKTTENGEMSHESDNESTDRASPIPEMILRDYQMEVARPALKGENVIMCLPTGSGKTRVAVYITKDHLRKRQAAGLPAKAIVLVNKVPLVEQHFKSEFHPFLKDSYKVTKISGDSQLKISFPKMVKENTVIICTAQILENALIQAAEKKDEGVSLSDFSLLIIDECHHTNKDGVYNNIMLRYIKQKKRNENIRKTEGPAKMVSLPQVVGLTASPGVGGANQSTKAEEHILRICANLDSRIMTVKEHIDQLQRQVKLPCKQVDIAEDKKKNPFGDKLKKMMMEIEQFGDLSSTSEHGTQSYEQWVIQKEKSAAKEGNRTQHVCADHLKRYNDALQISDTIRMNDALSHLGKFYIEEKKKILLLQETDAEGVSKEVDKTDSYLINLFYKEINNLERLAENEEYENEKLTKLRRAIMEEFTRNAKARGIVFTKTRQSAAALCQWISDNEKFKEVGIRAHFLIGAGSNSDFTSMTQNEQKKVIHKFTTGELNLLIATSVAEEGLDIPECNIVIMYGRITNEIAMMQTQIRELQSQNIVEKRVKKRKNMRKAYQQNPHLVTFLCRKCQKLAFSGSDISVIENMHHVIPDQKFKNKFKKGQNKTLQEKFADYQTNGEIICKDCGRTWGTMMVHKGLDLPCLKICNFVIKYQDQKITNDTLEIWSELPIKFPAFQYVEPDDSDDD
ncbi:PREDICTED: interferon-induced helicase C domain-containing protein 1 [Nanorana parkeri]|uniref:interferon-induced helicase C domain-containing protein 1 n=1 Tax=Nanorana parkeri TaxID=125878 RepID=UPI000854DBD9|nr:PREDICTED: interferon-induced helicase C domain-containing protein 1 [Nanorana parkeri]